MDIQLGFREVKFEFEDHNITIELKTLTRKAMLILTPLVADVFDEERQTDKAFLMGSSFEMQGAAAEVFPDHIKNIQGITVNNGEPVTIEHLYNESVFAPLAVDILLTLFNISNLVKDDEKNLDRQSVSIMEQEASVKPE